MINTNNLNLTGSTTITNPNNKDIFNRYLNEIGKYRPLSKEEEINLFKRLKTEPNNQTIIDKLCKHNLLFVVTIAKQYSKTLTKSLLTLEDLVNEGNIGLCKAIHKFDYTQGNKLISYAVWWIKSNILNCIQNNIKSIRLPNNIRAEINKFNKEEVRLEQKLNYKPCTSEVFDSMIASGNTTEKTTIKRFDELLSMNHIEKSLNTTVYANETTELSELLKSDDFGPDEIVINKERKELTNKMLEDIPSNIKDYYIDFFGLNEQKTLNLTEMGIKYKQRPETIKMRMDRYLRRMKYNNINLKTYFFPKQQLTYNY